MLACLVPIGWALLALVQQGQRLPYMDDWFSGFDMAVRAQDGSLDLNTLFVLHNEHIIVFTRLTIILSTWLTRWDLSALLVVNVLLAVGCALLLLRLTALDFGTRAAWLAALPIFALLFTLRGQHNLIVAFQNAIWITLFLFLLGVALLRGRAPGWAALFGAMACALGATFSFASGVVIWPLLVFVMIGRGYRKPQHYAVYITVAAISIWLFSRVLGLSTASSGLSAVLAQFEAFIRYLLLILANPFWVYDPNQINYSLYYPLLIAVGLAGIILLLTNAIWMRWRSHTLYWLSIAGFSLLTCALMVYGRFDVFQEAPVGAFSERYVTLSVPLWVVVVIMAIVAWLSKAPRILVVVNTLALMVIGGLHLAALPYLKNSPELPRVGYEACHHRTVYFDLGLECYPYWDNAVLREVVPERVRMLADRGLTIYGLPSLRISLLLQHSPVSATENEYFSHLVTLANDQQVEALREHPQQTLAYTLYLPTSHPHAWFNTAAYMDSRLVQDNPTVPQNGVRFTARVLDSAGQILSEQTADFDPNYDTQPISIMLDLTPGIGSTVTIELTTDSRGDANFDWAEWIDPVLIFSR